MQFDELRLAIGEAIRVEVRAPKLRVVASYAGRHFNESILLSLGGSALKLRNLPAGTQVTLRFIAANMACAFTTRIQKVQVSPMPILCLQYPEAIDAVQIRKDVRVQAKLLVSLESEDSLMASWPRQALCSDISLHGARIEASDLLGNVGDVLMVTARMPVGQVDQMLMTTGVIRNVEDFEDPQTGEFRVVHGIEFLDRDEETQLVLTGFVYEQMLKELGALG